MSASPTLLVVGFGDIGARTAKLALAAGWACNALMRTPRPSEGVKRIPGDLDEPATLTRLLDSLSDFRNRSENPAWRGQISPLLQGNSGLYYPKKRWNMHRPDGFAADFPKVRQAASQGAVLLHCAPPSPHGTDDTRTAHLLAALDSAPPRRMVYISTSGVYGDCGGAWVDETRPVHPGNARSRRRADAETQLGAYASRHGIPLVILRVPGIYGAGRLPLERLRRGEPVVCAQEAPWSNRIHQDDLARIAFRAAQDDAPPGIYNASDDVPSSMTDYLCCVADAAGLPRPPSVSLDEARQTFSPGMLEYLNESRRLDNRRMKEVLGVRLHYPALAEGLARIFST